MIRHLSRALILLSLILVWTAVVWLVIEMLFADQDMLIGASVAITSAVVAPFLCLLGWGVDWVADRTARRPQAV